MKLIKVGEHEYRNLDHIAHIGKNKGGHGDYIVVQFLDGQFWVPEIPGAGNVYPFDEAGVERFLQDLIGPAHVLQIEF